MKEGGKDPRSLYVLFHRGCDKVLFLHECISIRKPIWTFDLVILTYSIIILALLFWPYLGQIGRDQEGLRGRDQGPGTDEGCSTPKGGGPGGRPSATRRARFSGRRCARPCGRYCLEFRARKKLSFSSPLSCRLHTTEAVNIKQIFNYFCEKKTPYVKAQKILTRCCPKLK